MQIIITSTFPAVNDQQTLYFQNFAGSLVIPCLFAIGMTIIKI